LLLPDGDYLISPTVVLMDYDRARVVAAIRSWYARNGRPPSQVEWDAVIPEQPSARTIARRSGWSSLLREALADDEPGAGRQGSSWSRREMIEALIETFEETGVWPSGRSWARATAKHPASRTYVRLFGSWPAAIATAEADMRRRQAVDRPWPEQHHRDQG
jgi:hypothetical protein